MQGMKNQPYWADKRKPNTYYQPTNDEYDVVIIGGGLRGLSVLYWINRLTTLNCLVIDRSQLGGRATARSIGAVNSIPDGGINTHGEEAFLRRVELASDNRDLLTEAISKAEVDCSLVCNGGVHLSTGAQQDAQIELIQRALSKHGYIHEPLTTSEIFSLTGADGFDSGLFYPRDMTIDPLKLMDFFIADAMINKRHRIIENTKVVSVEDNDTHTTVMTDGGSAITTQYVIMCNNEMCDYVHIEPPHQFKLSAPKLAQCVATQQVDDLKFAYPMSCRTITGKNAWLLHDNRILYTCRDRKTGHAVDYMGLTAADVQIASAFFGKYFNTVNHGQVLTKQYVWTDFYLSMDELLPLVGPSKSSHRVIYNVGYDYSFLDIFFVCARQIGLHLHNGSEIRLGDESEKQGKAE
jgi:glycine/D-amino acid oxidase-like deaminating enzyme